MSTPSLSRRDLARLALASAAGLVMSNASSHADTPVTKPQTEGDILTEAVPSAVGYTLSEVQAKEVATALKDYPKGFAKGRAFALANDIEPAFASYAPQPSARKGRGK